MRRWSGWIAIGWLLLVCAVALALYGNATQHQSLNDRVRAVALEFRCLQCQGETVADSNSMFSIDVRRVIRADLQAGQSSDAIKRALVRSYGSRILDSPPATGIGSIAWLAPPLLVLGGVGLLAVLVTDWRTQGKARSRPDRLTYLERVRAELASDAAGE